MKALCWCRPLTVRGFCAVGPLVMLPGWVLLRQLSLDIDWRSWMFSLAMRYIEWETRRRLERMAHEDDTFEKVGTSQSASTGRNCSEVMTNDTVDFAVPWY